MRIEACAALEVAELGREAPALGAPHPVLIGGVGGNGGGAILTLGTAVCARRCALS